MLEKIKSLFNKKQPEQTIEDKYESLFEQGFTADIVRLEVGSDIAEFWEDICFEIDKYRNQIADNLGFIFPLVHVIEKAYLQENEIKLFIREREVINEFWIPNRETILEEVSGKLDYIYENYLDEIFTNEFFEKIINRVRLDNSWLIWNISCQYTVTEMRKVFINILKQNKSIKNPQYIFEKIGEIYPSVSCETLSKIVINELF